MLLLTFTGPLISAECPLSARVFEPYPFKDFTPHIKRVFEAYGPQRCYWGSDMTVAFDKATYRQRIAHFIEELPFLSESDKDWVMGKAILQRLKWA